MAKAGAPPKFQEAHVNWIFWKIATGDKIGRKAIVEETGLGEGSIRTILERLEDYGLIKSSRGGRSLTEDGRKVSESLKRMIAIDKLGPMDLTKAQRNIGVLVKGGASRIGTGMEQRDAAIKVGRKGVTTLIDKDGRLSMPGFDDEVDIDQDYHVDAKRIKLVFNPENGDAVIIGSEDTNQKAEEAAWIAASTILS